MANENLGETDCPWCGSIAYLRESTKSKKPYSMCSNPNCGHQGFARGTDSIKGMRAKMRAAAKAEENTEPPAKQEETPPRKKSFLEML